MLGRCCASLLVVLTLLPFTQPFATVELSAFAPKDLAVPHVGARAATPAGVAEIDAAAREARGVRDLTLCGAAPHVADLAGCGLSTTAPAAASAPPVRSSGFLLSMRI